MKSIMKKSLAVVMVLSMLLSFALPTFAVSAHTHEGDNTPCDCGAPVETEVVEATCMEHGGTWNTCTECGDTWVTNETPKLPYNDPKSHKLSTEAVAKDATCWAPGHTAAKACTVKGCDYQEGGEVIPQFTHGDPETDPLSSLVIDEQSLTSCLEGGVITYKCQFADVEGSQCSGYNGEFDEEYAADGHKHELRATGYQAPTCDAKGWVTIDCTVCTDTFKVAIAAKGHVWTKVVGEPAVCYEKGYYAGFYCAHEWLLWDENGNATKQSCSAYYITEVGHEDGTATTPLFTETDLNKEALTIPATNTHNPVKVTEEMFGEELAYQQPMCGTNAQPGWQWWVCAEADCDWSEKEILQPKHVNDGTMNTVTPPTCTTTGYTTHKCAICREYYEVDPTPIKHSWVSSSADGKVVYTFVKDGKVYVNEGDLREFDGNNMDLVINYIPYMVPAAQLLTDATAQDLMADGYTEMAWTVMTEVDCGEEGVYAHKCSKCPAKGFLTINVDHVWDRDLADLANLIPATCTEPGGYIGTCTICTEEFILSAAMVGELDPDYTGESTPTGHKSNLGPVHAKDPVTGEFLYPVEQAVSASCIAVGRESFNYCNNENCSEGLANYETALAAAPSIGMVAHQYYDAQGNAYKTERIPLSCMYPSYLLAKCNTCGLRIDEDEVAAAGKTAWELRIEGSEEGEFDGVSHVYPTYGEEGRPVATPPTCAKAGRYADVQCTLCPYVDIGVEIPVLDPGEVPTYSDSMTDGQVIDGWKVSITAPKCTTAGKVEVSCTYCAANNTTTHATTTIHTFEKTGIHFIAGATYIKNANGEYMTVKGAYVVDRATLTGAVASCTAPDCATTHIANAGGCNEKVNDLHADHYYCADCNEVIFFSVRFDHIAGATVCGKPTTCTECEKVLVAAEPHVMAKVDPADPAEIVGDDNDCSTEFYYHIECTRPGCDFDSKSADFEWTDEWKEIAEYVAAQEHDYNGMEEATCEKAMECVREGCDHVEEAAKDHDLVMDYQDPTCITLGYNIFRCKAGEKCDKAGAVIVEIGGVKYAEWRELDATSNYVGHDYDVDNDGEDDVYLARVGNCLTYNVVVYRCESCYGTATVDENGFISHGYVVEDFADPTGHKLVEHNTIEDCSNGGVYWSYCEYCFDETKYNAGENGLWNEVDYKGDKGYTEKEYKDPTGHWFWTTPAADATQEEIDAFVAEKVFFKLTCQDAIKYNNPTCEDCGETATPDMHILSEAFYEKETTCTENGLKWHSCTVEGCTYRSILEVELAFGHAAPYWKTATAATCCAPGTAILACRVCDAAIAEGDLVTALTEGEELAEGETFVPYNATADQLSKELDQLDHDFENGTVVSNDPATIHTPGKKVVQCALFCGVDADGKPVQCPVTDTIESNKLDRIEFSAEIDNVVKPGHMVFVNGGKIAYTIFIDGEEKDVYGLNFNVTYDASKLTFAGFDLGEDSANIFGTLDESGACNTWVGGTKAGVVSILASASPSAEGEIGYVTINEKQEFVTLYFDINADTVTDDPFDAGYNTSIAIEGVVIESISIGGDTTSPEIVFGNDYAHVATDAALTIKVEKLGDVNVIKNAAGEMVLSDRIINVRDVNAIEKLILAGEYDARADINQDGIVSGADMIAIQRYIINAHSYAEMVGVEEE